MYPKIQVFNKLSQIARISKLRNLRHLPDEVFAYKLITRNTGGFSILSKCMFRYSLYIFVLLPFILGSCYSVKQLEIEVLEPARIELPDELNSVSLINRSEYPYLESASNPLEIIKSTNLDIDSLASSEFLVALSNVLVSSPILDHQPPFDMRRFKPLDPLTQLNWTTLKTICDTAGTDGVISLEYFYIKDTLWVNYLPEYYTYESVLRFHNFSLWRIYNPYEQKVVDEYLVKDTLYWTSFGNNSDELVKGLPDKLSAAFESCFIAGEEYGFRITPVWIPVKRFYYTGTGKRMQEATEAFATDSLDKAIENWKELATVARKPLAARAAFNMALASELQDQLDVAVEWAIKSYFLDKKTSTKKYIDILTERRKKKEILEKQID